MEDIVVALLMLGVTFTFVYIVLDASREDKK